MYSQKKCKSDIVQTKWPAILRNTLWYWNDIEKLYYNIIFCNTDLMRELKFLIIM